MNHSTNAKLVIVGQGYVGLPIAMRAVEVGYDVVGLDVDARRVELLASGRSYVEDVSNEVLAAALTTGRFLPTADGGACAGFDYAIITVPTPLRESLPDLTFIEGASRILSQHLKAGATVILESTTYPGTTEELMLPILEEGSGLAAGEDFHAGYSPERIDPGNRTFHFQNTPKVVSGIDSVSSELVANFYASLVDQVVPVSTPREAELSKLLENTFRHVNIALVNELAVFAKDLGINVWEAIDAAATKPFGFMPFTPGPGVGGHCLPVDPSYLSWQVRRSLGYNFRFVELANDVNDHMPNYVVQRIMRGLNEHSRAVRGARILLLGLAYKRNTGDARESPALRVAELLAGLGAEVVAADPHVEQHRFPQNIVRVDASPDELRLADAVVILTDHDAFDFDAVAAAPGFLLDTRNRLRGRREAL